MTRRGLAIAAVLVLGFPLGVSFLVNSAINDATLAQSSEYPAQLRAAAAAFEALEAERDALLEQVAALDATVEEQATEIAALLVRIEELEAQIPPSPTPTTPPPVTCSGQQVAAGANLVNVTNAAPAGTTFCLAAGTYSLSETITAQEGDVFQGPTCSRDPGTFEVECFAFITWAGNNASQAMIRGEGFFEFSDIDISGATGNPQCNPDCGRAFRPNQGADFTRIDCHDNANQCVGSGGKHVRVYDSEIHHNGLSPDFQDDARSAAGIKRVRGASLEVHDSYVHHNGWVGVWCDFCENTYLVEGSIIEASGKNGLSWEVSGGWNGTDHAIITGNTIIGNNVLDNKTGAGITCNSCADLLIENNTFANNRGVAIRFIDAKRGPWRDLANIVVRNNDLGGESIIGCNFAGVTCEGNG